MIVRTVLGDINPKDLGVTYMHEHLIIDSRIVATDYPHIHLPNVEEAIAEVKLCVDAGVNSMVDCMPTGSGRSMEKLARISNSTGINIIASTGLHHARYYALDDPLESMTTSQLAAIFVEDITNGADSTQYKAGLIKAVSSGREMTVREERLFESAAIAQKSTGAPILTHCEHGTGALRQLEKMQSIGIDLSHVVLSHTDQDIDFGYHQEILSTGVFVEYDQSLRQMQDAQAPSAKLTAAMIEKGFINQIMLGTDGARRTLWKSLGGTPGLAALYTEWGNKLRALGVTQENLNTIFISNPARALSFKVT